MRHQARIHALIVWTLLFGGAASPPTTRPVVVRLSLNDAMAIAFENSDVVRTLDAGRVVVPSVTSYDPAIVNEQTQAALAAFDTSFASQLRLEPLRRPARHVLRSRTRSGRAVSIRPRSPAD